MPIPVTVPATLQNFNEAGYLKANSDIAKAVSAGSWKSGFDHFKAFGHSENRKQFLGASIETIRSEKLARIEPLLRRDLPFMCKGSKFDFLSQELRALTGIQDTENISGHGYGKQVQQLIADNSSGLILDCGSGFRPVYYENVVNYEIVDYYTTDVIGVGEELPFIDEAFDAVISVAVLEHVKDPFRCASELKRVLKRGGTLLCAVPFLQPYHGYPHHYFNMTGQGAKSLFEDAIDIHHHEVENEGLPIFSLSWILNSWAHGLSGQTREDFCNKSVRELMAAPGSLLNQTWVTELSREKNFELACGCMMIGTKRQR